MGWIDRVDDPIRPRELTTIQGKRITIPEPKFRTHLQFRRFAGCPRCSLHLRSIARRHDEILGAGLREVVVLYSSAQAMEPHQGDLPSPARGRDRPGYLRTVRRRRFGGRPRADPRGDCGPADLRARSPISFSHEIDSTTEFAARRAKVRS